MGMSAWEDRLRESLERALNVPVFTGPPIEGLTDEQAEKQDRDRFPQAMIEGSTEYDWADLPEWLKEVMRHAADEFRNWADAEPIKGEVVPSEVIPDTFADQMAARSLKAVRHDSWKWKH